jgi:alcohol dehydrogenase class IV
MNKKSLVDSLCWEMAKQYFHAMDKSHISRMIEHAANKQFETQTNPNELDSEELERIGPTGR